jgi:hypothetical protein
MATRLNPTNFGYQNFYSATLTGDITSGTLTIGLDTVPSPTSGILVIDPDSTTGREVILYTSKGASTITCPSDGRGYSGSTAAAHLTGTTVIMAPIDKWFTALASGELSSDPLRTELFFDYIASGCVWSGDAYASTRNASMTSGVMYIGGRRLTASLISARSFTASKDTYIDASDNGDGTVLITYTEVANNAASPALAANSVRIGIIVTGATNIAAAGSVNQGQTDKVLPIASSVPYQVTDSLGNLICPRDPNRRLLGYRQRTSNFTAGGGPTQVTELSCPVIVPSDRKVKITVFCFKLSNTLAGASNSRITAWAGAVGGTQVAQVEHTSAGANYGTTINAEAVISPAAGLTTYNAALTNVGGTLATMEASTAAPTFIKIELE